MTDVQDQELELDELEPEAGGVIAPPGDGDDPPAPPEAGEGGGGLFRNPYYWGALAVILGVGFWAAGRRMQRAAAPPPGVGEVRPCGCCGSLVAWSGDHWEPAPAAPPQAAGPPVPPPAAGHPFPPVAPPPTAPVDGWADLPADVRAAMAARAAFQAQSTVGATPPGLTG